MSKEEGIALLIGGAEGKHISQLGRMANRHGLVTGATGTGKTVTLQILAEGFARMGVPVLAADIKGDLSGVAESGKPHPKVDERVQVIGIDDFAFRIADDNGMLLLDLKDLRSMLVWVGENAKELKLEYGNISGASIGAIQRRLLTLEEQGADKVFGEPELDIDDLMRTDEDGHGVINILDATQVIAKAPDLYACFLFWLLSELFEELPEQGARRQRNAEIRAVF